MFRLADFQEGTPLYKYLSGIASRTIYAALDDAYGNMPTIEDFYANTFSADVRDVDFFKGLSKYISERADVKNDEFEDLGFALIGYAVNAMYGTVDIQSELGKGTTFTVTIPQLVVN